MKRPARVPSQLSESLHKRLSAYTLAASAAGVGMLCLAQSAHARIVYTPAGVTLGDQIDHVYQIALDLNHDGINDFALVNYLTGNFGDVVYVSPAKTGNSAVGYRIYASALPSGVRIGGGTVKRFDPAHRRMVIESKTGPLKGPWYDVTNRYLGLKFQIRGKIHYGWARLSVTLAQPFEIVGTLTGYAYETIPNKPIIAGKTHGKDEATLGRLAQGAYGVVREKK